MTDLHSTTAVNGVYPASPIKRRRRATNAEMDERAAFLIAYAEAHGPVTVRQLYYQAEVAGLPGIEKTEAGYGKVQAQVLKLRRQGQLSYACIADATRWMRKPRTHDHWEDALEATIRTYRRSLWQDVDTTVEVWIEKDALAGVIYPVTEMFDVPLMVSRGFTSETFVYEAVAARRGSDRPYVVIALYDFDRSGQDAARSHHEKLKRFGADFDLDVEFQLLALNAEDVQSLDLPTRPPKRNSAADRRWPYDFACELDAIPPDDLRAMVRHVIEAFLPQEEYARLRRIEQEERATLRSFLDSVWGEDDEVTE